MDGIWNRYNLKNTAGEGVTFPKSGKSKTSNFSEHFKTQNV